MNFVLQPWHFLLAILTGWVNEHSRRQIDFLHTEMTILKDTFGTKRPRLTNDQRRPTPRIQSPARTLFRLSNGGPGR